jgi:hypothetical protein
LAYDEIEPSGNVESTYMLALLCATVVNTVSAIFQKKGSQNKPISPDAFIPKWGRTFTTEDAQTAEQTLAEQKAAILLIAKAFNTKKRVRNLPPPSKRKGVSKT